MAAEAAREIEDPVLYSVLAYWRQRRGERAMPRPEDIDPLGLGPRVLPHLVLVDVEAGGQLRFRLCGTAIVEAVGRDLKGRLVEEFHPDREYGAWLISLYRRVLADKRPLYSESTYVSPAAGVARRTFRLVCPLSADGETVTRILGAQTFTFDPPPPGTAGEPDRYQTGPIHVL